MFNHQANDKQWFKVAIKLRKKGKLAEPYHSLLDYYLNLTVDAPIRRYSDQGCGSHFLYFCAWQAKGQLAELSRNLSSILPQKLRDNFWQALNKFQQITDPDADENYDLFATEDAFVDEQAVLIKDLLANYIRQLNS